MSDEIIGWVQKAEADYQAARILLRQRKMFLPDNICWNCQQSAEKYLKAYLVRGAVDYPRRHDLVQLGNLCADADPASSWLPKRLPRWTSSEPTSDTLAFQPALKMRDRPSMR